VGFKVQGVGLRVKGDKAKSLYTVGGKVALQRGGRGTSAGRMVSLPPPSILERESSFNSLFQVALHLPS